MRILNQIRDRGKLTVSELCETLRVSPATVCADLRDLDRECLLTRPHGGAIEKVRTGFELTTNRKRTENRDCRRCITRKAAKLVEDGDSIVPDTGTTVLEQARLLVRRRRLTVVTNDLEIVSRPEEAPGIQVVVPGGLLRKDFHCTTGPLLHHMARELRVDRAFMGVNRLSLENGAGTPDLQHAETKKTMASIA
ncbi:MAG: DeoR/GlpR family DNA-binding transcription regulator [Planctomycetia bacterium]|nr:DeoR/GlpR family DNA-binding transcription regulator [Planctomycetia bacterium]